MLRSILTSGLQTVEERLEVNSFNIQGVSGGIVNILGGGSMDYSE